MNHRLSAGDEHTKRKQLAAFDCSASAVEFNASNGMCMFVCALLHLRVLKCGKVQHRLKCHSLLMKFLR